MAEQQASDTLKGDKKLLATAKERLKACIDDEDNERIKMKDDLRFCTLDQWPEKVRTAREKDPNGARPCLTIDKINPYITQVVNDIRQNRPAIKIRPVDSGADVATAKIYAGVVRHIEDRSNASVSYETAGESIARIGLGYFRVTTEYTNPASGDQDIYVRPILDTFSVYLQRCDRQEEREYGFILEEVPVKRFEREYPKAKSKEADFDEISDKPTWRTGEYVTVCEYFYKEYEATKLYFRADGSTVNQKEYDAAGGAEGMPDAKYLRDSHIESIRWCKLTGAEILEKRDWAGKFIPIIEVVGRESFVDGKRVLWGLVRPVKDNLRMYNYWASAATERMALAPKTPFIGAVGQFAGKENQWKKANTDNRAYLEYNAVDVGGNALPRPERVAPAPTEVAMVQMMQTIEHDVHGSLGVFKAGLGEQQGQQSGRAILALQRESDTGTFHFADNLSRAIRFGGQIIVDLIPKIYDTRRVMRILGEDGEPSTATIDPNQQEPVRHVTQMDGSIQSIYNLGVGEYDVTVTVGPSYNTKRMEAATTFAELAKGAADPASAAVMRYLTVKNSDFTSSEEAIKALKALLPPPVLQAISTDEPISPKAQAAIGQMHQKMQQMAEQGQELQAENVKLKSGEQAKMAGVQVDAQKGQAEIQLKAQAQQQEMALEQAKVQGQIALENAKLELERAKAAAQIELERVKADAALQLQASKQSGDQQMQAAQLNFDMQCRVADDTAKREEKAVAEKEKREAAEEKTVSNSEKLLEKIVELLQNPPPMNVVIGAVQKGADGAITGANISKRPAKAATLQ